jgi:predicted RNA binding protein with dsRBD fold (UPF0201 family)
LDKVKVPQIACKIEAYAAVHPSEDPQKVQQAVANILSKMDFKYEDGSIKASSQDLGCLSKIYDIIRSRQVTRAYRRLMKYHMHDDTTWFYLNKQAAFVNVIAVCDEAEESPLGPIKIILHSKNIERIMDWLAPEFVE